MGENCGAFGFIQRGSTIHTGVVLAPHMANGYWYDWLQYLNATRAGATGSRTEIVVREKTVAQICT